jgi:hypothetical protein
MRGLEPQGRCRCRGCACLVTSVTAPAGAVAHRRFARARPLRGPASRPPGRGDVGRCLVGGRCRPEEARELTGDGDGGHVMGFAAGFHVVVDVVKAMLGLVRDLDHCFGLVLLTGLKRHANCRSGSVLQR